MDQGAQIVELCTRNADGVRSCVEQAHGLMIWGSFPGTAQQGFALVLGAYLSGFLVAAIRRTLGV